jgi:hypothetical protein
VSPRIVPLLVALLAVVACSGDDTPAAPPIPEDERVYAYRLAVPELTEDEWKAEIRRIGTAFDIPPDTPVRWRADPPVDDGSPGNGGMGSIEQRTPQVSVVTTDGGAVNVLYTTPDMSADICDQCPPVDVTEARAYELARAQLERLGFDPDQFQFDDTPLYGTRDILNPDESVPYIAIDAYPLIDGIPVDLRFGFVYGQGERLVQSSGYLYELEPIGYRRRVSVDEALAALSPTDRELFGDTPTVTAAYLTSWSQDDPGTLLLTPGFEITEPRTGQQLALPTTLGGPLIELDH